MMVHSGRGNSGGAEEQELGTYFRLAGRFKEASTFSCAKSIPERW